MEKKKLPSINIAALIVSILPLAALIPATHHILDSYPNLSVAEKNSLRKIILEKITVYRTPEGEFSLHVYPQLPM